MSNEITFEDIIEHLQVGSNIMILSEDWDLDPHTTYHAEVVEIFPDAIALLIDFPGQGEHYAEISEEDLPKVYKGPTPEFL